MAPARALIADSDRLEQWLARLIEQVEVVGPVCARGGDVQYTTITSAGDVLWTFGNALAPPKQVLLPQTEPLATIRRGPDGHELDPVTDDHRRVIFNIRSCDAKGLAYLKAVHAADLPDESFRRKIDNTILVSLACVEPGEDCFCVCTSSGPFLSDSTDVQLTDLGDRFLVEPLSAIGGAMLEESRDLFAPAEEADLAVRMTLEERARRSFGDKMCHVASAMRRVSTGRVDDALWTEMSDWCLECGGCTLVCPTCYCFSVKDQPDDGGWVRCRTWDSCQYAAFTLEASGHNPRPERKDRLKRRFFHKVSAQYLKRDGLLGCVGCGRCVAVCPSSTHMPAIVTAIRKGVWHG